MFADDYERFYTDSKFSKDDDFLVDQIYIDTKNKEYYIVEDEGDYITDGYDEEDNMICSSYVSREVFELLVDAVKSNGYTLADFDTVQYDEDEDEDYDDEDEDYDDEE